jgi:hypothetical protein
MAPRSFTSLACAREAAPRSAAPDRAAPCCARDEIRSGLRCAGYPLCPATPPLRRRPVRLGRGRSRRIWRFGELRLGRDAVWWRHRLVLGREVRDLALAFASHGNLQGIPLASWRCISNLHRSCPPARPRMTIDIDTLRPRLEAALGEQFQLGGCEGRAAVPRHAAPPRSVARRSNITSASRSTDARMSTRLVSCSTRCCHHCAFAPRRSSAASFCRVSSAPGWPACFATASARRNCTVADAVSPVARKPSPRLS